MKTPLIILGAGGHAKVIMDIVKSSDSFEIKAVIGKEDEQNDNLNGYEILKGDRHLAGFLEKGIANLAIGVGAYKDNGAREQLFHRMLEMGFNLPNIIHTSAYVSPFAKLGSGNVVSAGVVINPNSTIGDNVIISAGVIIEHDAIIEDHVLLSTGVVVGAGSRICHKALLGLGSRIIPRMTVGAQTLVAAGAVVVNDIPESSAVYGLPARPRSRFSERK